MGIFDAPEPGKVQKEQGQLQVREYGDDPGWYGVWDTTTKSWVRAETEGENDPYCMSLEGATKYMNELSALQSADWNREEEAPLSTIEATG